jgi:hypothetical protein
MIVSYTELPDDAGGWPRPLLDIAVADMDEVRYPCLVDSGSVNTLLPRWLAEAAGISLRKVERRFVAVATTATDAALTVVRLAVGGHAWEGEVGFCDPWPFSWGLLGQRSFFRYFTVVFRAADFEFEIQPVPH